jgi:iron complex outermembrane recepter protein
MAPVTGASARPAYAVLPPSALKRMSVEELLQQEVVSVSRRPEYWGQAASSIFVLRGEAARLSGASHLPELLRLAPNLFVAQSNSSHWGVNARGFVRNSAYSNKLLVLVDGRTVYSPFFSNVFWDSTDVFLPDLDRIEVISGPAGANWGSNAVNGVINVLTKSAHLTQGGVVYAGAGTLEEATFGVRHGSKVGAGGAYRVYAKTSKQGATRASDGARDDWDEWTSAQAGFRADWGTPATAEYSLHGDVFQGRFDNGPLPQTRADGANVVFRWARQLTADDHLTVRAYHDYAMRDIQRLYVARTRTTDIDAQYRFALRERQEVMIGGQYRWIDDRVGETVGFAILPPHLQFALGSVFAQHEFRSDGGQLSVTSGLRLEHNEFTAWENQPHVRVAWRPSPHTTVWAAAARTTRTPSRLEKGFFAGTPPDYFVAGAPELRAERLHAYEIGWRGLAATGLSLSATAFQHDYGDLRSVEPGPPVVQANGVRGRSRGVEVFMDYDVASWWRLRAGGFAVDQDTWLAPGSQDQDRGWGEASFPEHQLLLRSTFWWRENVSTWFSLRRVDRVPTLETPGFSFVPAYTELDARIAWFPRSDFELSITARNLLDRSHPEIGPVATRREIPRSVQLMVRWDY